MALSTSKHSLQAMSPACMPTGAMNNQARLHCQTCSSSLAATTACPTVKIGEARMPNCRTRLFCSTCRLPSRPEAVSETWRPSTCACVQLGVGNPGPVDTLAQCLIACESAPGCSAVTYLPVMRNCFLKGCPSRFTVSCPVRGPTLWDVRTCALYLCMLQRLPALLLLSSNARYSMQQCDMLEPPHLCDNAVAFRVYCLPCSSCA